MFILDKPFVSDLLANTIRKNSFEHIKLHTNLFTGEFPNSLSNEVASKKYGNKTQPRIYTNSESAIDWVAQHLTSSNLPNIVTAFKDKAKFRELIKKIYPDYFFKKVAYNELQSLDINSLPYPFIIKPNVGFFSIGVHQVNSIGEWDEVLANIKTEVEEVENVFPNVVVDNSYFIIEEYIAGDEFAFDAYYNEEGEPIILGIFKHLFSSGTDVSDRVYITSKEIIEQYISPFTTILKQFGELVNAKNIPVHVEVRVNENNEIAPIEINPLRFGGWCTTADLTTYAYDLNPYEYFYKNLIPNWNDLLKDKQDLIYSIVILNNSTGYKSKDIADFNFHKLTSSLIKPLDLRKLDWKTYDVFGIMFCETPANKFTEIEELLISDLKEFVIM